MQRTYGTDLPRKEIVADSASAQHGFRRLAHRRRMANTATTIRPGKTLPPNMRQPDAGAAWSKVSEGGRHVDEPSFVMRGLRTASVENGTHLRNPVQQTGA